jgi:large subunit ribosomal protein L13
MKTYFPKPSSNDDANWVIVDASGQTVGRLATQVAQLLRGKHKVDYTPNQLCGDYVVVINADKVVFTGSKMDDKVYTRYSGYPSGLKTATPRQILSSAYPERVLHHAIKGMLPKNRLGRRMIKRLKVYAGDAHPHAAQQPQPLGVN